MNLHLLDAIGREGALIFFLTFFFAVIVWVSFTPTQRFREDAELPLNEGGSDDE